ncbi:hypothetical protein [Flavobacterium terrae]|uniref:Pre-peptidase C-terminal domain-containing protein n=1 Tax=Flavobacterium terrae TaxID=415425 RepID=A0A1M6DHQ5_9FLAO|nr:hypothetical protein [Flavobacterium terrae]SHI72887.1 hypothetical protein SAMN05444363_1464 [Flavobacterium terrae]
MNFRKITILSAIFALFTIMVGCNEDDDNEALNYASLEMSNNIEVEANATKTGSVKVYASAVMSYDRTYSIVVNTAPTATTMPASDYTVPATVTIPANSNVGTFNVTVTGNNLGTGKKIALNLAAAPGIYVGKPLTINVTEFCNGSKVKIDFLFDDYASETSWELIDENSNLVASGDGYADGDASFSTQLCLAAGHYYFVIYDSYGDGMTGTYTVSNLSDSGAILVTGGGDFGTDITEEFDIN